MGEGREGLQFFSVRRVRQMVDSSEKGSVIGTVSKLPGLFEHSLG